MFSIDDQVIFRLGLASVVASEPRLFWAGAASDASEARRYVAVLQPDVVVLDTDLRGSDGLALLRQLKARLPCTEFLALSASAGADKACAALAEGARSYVLKTATPLELLQSILLTAQGRRCVTPAMDAAIAAHQRKLSFNALLTTRELTVLELMTRGMANREIAGHLGIGLPTAKFHVTNILSKLQVDSRMAAVLKALRLGLVVLARRTAIGD